MKKTDIIKITITDDEEIVLRVLLKREIQDVKKDIDLLINAELTESESFEYFSNYNEKLEELYKKLSFPF